MGCIVLELTQTMRGSGCTYMPGILYGVGAYKWSQMEQWEVGCSSLWPSGIGAHLDRTGCEFDSWTCRIYIIPHVHRTYTITWLPSGFSGYIWLDKNLLQIPDTAINSSFGLHLIRKCVTNPRHRHQFEHEPALDKKMCYKSPTPPSIRALSCTRVYNYDVGNDQISTTKKWMLRTMKSRKEVSCGDRDFVYMLPSFQGIKIAINVICFSSPKKNVTIGIMLGPMVHSGWTVIILLYSMPRAIHCHFCLHRGNSNVERHVCICNAVSLMRTSRSIKGCTMISARFVGGWGVNSLWCLSTLKFSLTSLPRHKSQK